MPRLTLLLVTLLVCATQLDAQTPATMPDSTFQVSTAQPWTDTGLDLQSGDMLEISAAAAASSVPDRHAVPGAAACDPKGVSTDQTNGLPLPSAPAGALLARLHAQGAAPLLVGASAQLQIEEASHLFLGMNVAGAAPCQGGFAVKVHRIPAGTTAAATSSAVSAQPQSLVSSSGARNAQSTPPTSSSAGTAEAQQSRGDQLKSQLSNAAQVFMQGQFGIGKPESGTNSNSSSATSSGATSNADASPAPVLLKVSDTPLDSELRKKIDSLPRRVNDQLQNLGDMVNFVIVGPEKDVQAALDAATWHVADTDNSKAVINAILQTYDKKDYLAMPMSTLFLFGRKQDFGYEMAEPIAMVASRHHFRIWKASFTWKGSDVWVGAGTHDIGFAKDKRNNNVTHKIDPAVDGERDNIGSSLQKANKAKMLSYYLPPNPVQDAKNATGDGYHSDGRLLVIFLQ
ncbi:MAG TPA: LssY C-terminal domain-containing protein [Candidatus Sulfotelmatobacter sp.]|nr:LssY C-terminal domain-containing protein [Candidatus Sulfotelmatobacter sp.]